MPKDKIKIEKSVLPKARKSWKLKPATKVKESSKVYKRQKAKQKTRKAIKNGNNK